MTLATQIENLKQRFRLEHVVLVGDRGMVTQARITEDIKEGGALQLSLFDQRDMASITAPDFPGERLVVCRNPDLAAQRTRKREDLLTATERDLAPIQATVARKRDPLRGTAKRSMKYLVSSNSSGDGGGEEVASNDSSNQLSTIPVPFICSLTA